MLEILLFLCRTLCLTDVHRDCTFCCLMFLNVFVWRLSFWQYCAGNFVPGPVVFEIFCKRFFCTDVSVLNVLYTFWRSVPWHFVTEILETWTGCFFDEVFYLGIFTEKNIVMLSMFLTITWCLSTLCPAVAVKPN